MQDAENTPTPRDTPLPVVFDRLLARASERNRAIHAALEGSRLLEYSDEELLVEVPESFSFRRLTEKREELQAIAVELFGSTTKLKIQQPVARPQAATTQNAPDPLKSLKEEALHDPGIALAMEILDAEIVAIRSLQEET